MDYENLVIKFKKYHYIIVVGKKASVLGSSNSSEEDSRGIYFKKK